jgi:phage-related protein
MAYDLGTARGTIELKYEGANEVKKADKDMKSVDKESKNLDGSLKKLGGTLKGLFTGVKATVLVTALTNAAVQAAALGVQILGIIPDLVAISSLASALPGIFVGVAASLGVVKAITHGVGDAIKAAFDPKGAAKFQEALKELSPEAARFVTALKAAQTPLENFQKGLQESFFQSSGLTKLVPQMIGALNTLKDPLTSLADGFGNLTNKVANFVLSTDSLSFIADSVTAFDAAVQSAARALDPLLTGLRNVGEVGLPLLLRLGDAVGDVGIKFGDWLTAVSNDGRLQSWIDTAIDTLKTLGTLVGNIGSILSSVLGAANETGGGLLNTLADITGEFATFLKSAEGSAAIRSLFSGILELAKQLSPIFTTIAGVLGTSLGPVLADIAKTIGPVLLDVIQRLAPAFGPLITAAADLVTALAPLLPPIAELVSLLAGVLTTAISTLVAEFEPLISIIADALTGAFEDFGPVVAEMAKGLPVAAKAGIALAEAFAPLIPVVAELATVFADSLIAVMPDLISAAEQLIPVFVDLAAIFAKDLADGLKTIVPLIPGLVKLFATMLPIIVNIATFGFRLATIFLSIGQAAKNLLGNLGTLVSYLTTVLGAGLKAAYDAVVAGGGAVLEWFRLLPGRVLAGIKALPGLLLNFFNGLFQGLATAIGFGAGLIVGFFTKLLPRIIEGIRNLPVQLAKVFIAAGTAMYNAVQSAGNTVYAFFQKLPGRIYGAISALGSRLAAIFRSAVNSGRNAVVSAGAGIYNFFHDLPGRIRSALGNLGGLLLQSGKNIVNGLLNGIQSAAGRVLDYVQGLANRVRDAFNNALSIFSPSRDFFDSGVNIGKGVILGIKDQLKNVKTTAQLLAQTTIAPTLTLPSAVSNVARSIGVPRDTAPAPAAGGVGGDFGPYLIAVDGKVLASFVVDTITGNPKVVSKAASEGDREATWNGSGRKAA